MAFAVDVRPDTGRSLDLPAPLRSGPYARTMPSITLPADRGSQPGYLSRPAVGDGPWPGVVLIHDLFGIHNDMRVQADWLAAAGYLTVIPDLYLGKSAVRCVQGTFRQLTAQRGPLFDRIDAARGWLADREDCTGRIGIIGFCMGGGFALLLAGRPGWTAASINYGILPENLDEVLAHPCPIVGSFGGQDKQLAGAADKLRVAVQPSGVAADIKEYPRAGHGFMNRVVVASPLATLMKVMNLGYDHPSSEDAHRRILAFFADHLQEPAGPESDQS